MIRKMMPLIIVLLLLMPLNVKAASEWNQAVTVYGAGLENNQELLDATSEILGVMEEDKIEYVRSGDVEKYLGVTYDDSVLKSSIRILQKDEGQGLDITVDESMGQITKITEETYKNALLTSGITDAEVVIGAAEDVTGESALSGIYKAYEAQGEEIDPERTQNAQDELEAISDIAEENSNVEGFSQEQLNKMITEIKIQVIEAGGNLSEGEIRNIVGEELEANGLNGVLEQDQIDRITVIIMNIQDSGLFQSEEAQRLLDSSKNLIDDITSSEGFQDAKDSAQELGKDIQESGAWESFKNAVSDFFKAIVDFFRSLF
ncbi:DUF1002 domain-containing protein [Salinicoccus halodurans]|uniref:Uncharacterized protein YpuA, DUF1002 family n=1 Tax=Salinicoccus halodurans TaxID=407035 RepID=A0AA94KV07_9STAP|nr:DUF1002 domain-containing protein [Salinicoccus halodurans]SFK61274.1 Uncharacterized protein YpuA, DUF1002 family [Salinicoccus halodurans]